MITNNISTLKINKLTQAQYDRELAAGRIDENALYLTPDEEKVPTSRTINGKALSEDITLVSSDIGAAREEHTHNELRDGFFTVTLDAEDKALNPKMDNIISLGGASKRYSAIYGVDGVFSNLTAGESILPASNGLEDGGWWIDIGKSDNRFYDVYAIDGDFAGDVNGVRFISENGCGLDSYDSNGDRKNLVFLSSSNNINIGVDHVGERTHTGSTYINSASGNVALYTPAGYVVWDKTTSSTDGYTGIFRPSTDNKALLGTTSCRWKRVTAGTSTIATSDEREKSDITPIADYPVTFSRNGSGNIFEQLFDKLNPTTYYFNDDEKPELHIGFIAQDIVKAAEELGMSEDDLAFIDHGFWTDEETGEERDRYGLAYEEFIALNTYVIQKQKEKINTLEERIAKLEESINNK